MRILTKQEAIDSGMTASQIRTVARSLQRIARKGYRSPGYKYPRGIDLKSFGDYRTISRNAYELLKLAREV